MSSIRAAARVVVVGAVLLVIPAILAGCGDNRPLSQVANEDFGEHALVTGSSLFFNEPATLIFAFTDKWELYSANKQELFMKDTGQVWQKKVENSDIDVSETKVQYENRMGEVIAEYTPDGGLKVKAVSEPGADENAAPE